MGLIALLDNEVPLFGEWDPKVENGDATIVQTPVAAYPAGVGQGLRGTVTRNGWNAYVVKDFAKQSTIYLGFWWRPVSNSLNDYQMLFRLYNTSIDYLIGINDYGPSTGLKINVVGKTTYNYRPYTLGQWYYLVLYMSYSGGTVTNQFYFNGSLIETITRPSGTTGANRLYAGTFYSPRTSGTAVSDFDEIQLSTTYPTQMWPRAAGKILQPRRCLSRAR